jgi:hypothetical protein
MTEGTESHNELNEPKERIIFVNRKQLKVEQDNLTGSEILQLAGYDPSQYDLYLVHGQESTKVEPSQLVEIKLDMHFNAILRNVPYGTVV